MLIALLADIHANREALVACLDHARAGGADRVVFLGDYVGYGADPEFAVECVSKRVEEGALAVLGNHDAAVSDPSPSMNTVARIAIDWTRGQLDSSACAFLKRLPLTADEGDRLYVHSDASAPARWNYVLDAEDAAMSLAATPARITFCAHVHVPTLYARTATGKLTRFRPVSGVPVPLKGPRQWLAVIGSVGQPRDGNPAAAYALYDDVSCELTFMRAPYDVDKVAAKIRAAGLPDFLAERLKVGR